MKGSTHHRVHAALTFIVALVAGVILIPLLRSQPESVHKFANGLNDWQRTGFILILSVLYTHTMFKLFSPRIVHLRYLWTHPPTWFAWLFGIIVVGLIDVRFGLTGYQGTWREWLGFGAGSIGLVAVYRHLSRSASDEHELSWSQHWIHATVAVTATVVSGVILLPLVRDEPDRLHEFVLKLPEGLRVGLEFILCLIVACSVLSLLSPRIRQTNSMWKHPPVWLGVLLGAITVAVGDIFFGLDANGYQGSWQEWFVYGAGSIVAATVIRISTAHSDESEPEATPQKLRLQDVENAEWKDIETWLCSDAPADYDFLGNRSVARRLANLLASGTRSIGIVGPFGAGKSSIVQWLEEELGTIDDESSLLFFSVQSCWGYENSSSSIHEMLAQAIGVVEEEIDTFHVSSLPESYRQTFSAGGKWIDKLSNLIIGRRRPSEQFESLSELLGDLKAKVIIVVEDLDRNDSRSFDAQEVLAFLQQLKDYENISFVLTGGLTSTHDIDFNKLCDRIEYLPSIETEHAATLVSRVSERCLDQAVFPHVSLTDDSRQYLWNPLSGMMMRDFDELSLPQAVASLLDTPRALRHALSHTYSAWRTLNGEIDLNHLLGLNVIRFGAPEAFLFLIRRWDRVNSPPSQDPTFGQERISQIRQSVLDDWNNTVEKVEWNLTAALMVIESFLPATEIWLTESNRSVSSDTPQGLQYQKYWRRAIYEEIDNDDVRDQQVLADIGAWLESPSIDALMIGGITSNRDYSKIWEKYSARFFLDKPEAVLLLCEQVLRRLLQMHGASASQGSQGFRSIYGFAWRRVGRRFENSVWLKERISQAAPVSIELVNALWHYFGNPGRASVVRDEEGEEVRQHVLQTMRQELTNANSLISRLRPDASETIYQLVTDAGSDGDDILTDVQSWRWLGPVILAGLRQRSVVVAANCAVLLAARDSRRGSVSIDEETLFGFFGDDASETINIIADLNGQMQESEQQFVANVVAAAREAIEGQSTGDDHD